MQHNTAPTYDERRRLDSLRSYEILDTEVEDSFEEIVRLASHVCDTPIAVINFIDQNRQWFKAEAGLGVRETPLDISICRHALLEEDVMVIEDTHLDTRTCGNPLALADDGLRFYAGALIRSVDGYPLGTLCVLDRRPRQLSCAQLDMLKALRNQLMLLLEYRRTNLAQQKMLKELDEARDAMAKLAHEDSLTGLLNRRAFESRLGYELSLRNAQKQPATVIMIDLDHFKRINDTFGHPVGDKALRQVADVLRGAIRSSDVISRWGGEEFIALLPDTPAQEAEAVANRIHTALAGLPLQKTLANLALSASIGITHAQKGDTPESIVCRADQALYDAKRQGRQRTNFR